MHVFPGASRVQQFRPVGPSPTTYRVSNGRNRSPANVVNSTKLAEGYAGIVYEVIHGLVYALCPDDDPSRDIEYNSCGSPLRCSTQVSPPFLLRRNI